MPSVIQEGEAGGSAAEVNASTQEGNCRLERRWEPKQLSSDLEPRAAGVGGDLREGNNPSWVGKM